MNYNEKFDIDKPLWDQSTYIGRVKHYFFISEFNTVVSEKKLWEAKKFCDDYKMGKIPPGTDMSDIIRAKQLRDSAFHLETGELLPMLGRLSYQLPVSVILTTAMLTFQKSTAVMVASQMINHMHNAIINYTYRIPRVSDDKNQMRNAFLCAVLASTIMTVTCKKLLYQRTHSYSRCVPFCGVAIGHVVNLPIVRYKDIALGMPLFLKDEKTPLMKSKVAALKGTTECIISRILMSLPCLLLVPVLTQKIMTPCFSQRQPWLLAFIETSLCAFL
ncbi:Sideroflexin-1 [Habropoda laboriosa]|uniref:Sideroflexin-1 n=1 Tax=Habropoda laboriosa TaxID=597456 RepID=A0A0L7R317_9HYME|nr:Sideroflexin-1 [Habropoda laboriosa]